MWTLAAKVDPWGELFWNVPWCLSSRTCVLRLCRMCSNSVAHGFAAILRESKEEEKSLMI